MEEQRSRHQSKNEEDDPELAAAASRVAASADAAVADSRQDRVRSAASASSERSADRSLDGLELEDEPASPTAKSVKKKDLKKEKNKSGLLKGLFGSKKNKVGMMTPIILVQYSKYHYGSVGSISIYEPISVNLYISSLGSVL